MLKMSLHLFKIMDLITRIAQVEVICSIKVMLRAWSKTPVITSLKIRALVVEVVDWVS